MGATGKSICAKALLMEATVKPKPASTPGHGSHREEAKMSQASWRIGACLPVCISAGSRVVL